MSAGSSIIPASRYGAALPADYYTSGYEGAQYSGVRSGFFLFPTDARLELNRYTRVELLRKKRALEANLPIVTRIQSAVGRKSVGKGLFPKPRTSDPAWNKENRRQFLNRASNPSVWSVDASMDFFEQTRFMAETRFGDGEAFAIFSKAATGMLQVDVRDPMECCSNADDEENGWTDGIRTNKAGRPLAYRFQTGSYALGDADSVIVPASAVCHLKRVRRAKTLRAVTEFYAGINSMIDVLDLKALVTGTAKLHSALGVKVKRNKGDAGKTGITGQLEKLLGPNGETTKVSENFAQGAAIAFLAENEDIDLVYSEHPGANILEFLKFLCHDVVIGTDQPFSVIYSMLGLGGTPTRAEMEDGQDFYNQEQDRVAWRFCQKAYIVDTAIRQQMGLIGYPNNDRTAAWWEHDWRGPAKITVDKSRTSKSDIDRMHNMMLTWGMYFDELGIDSEDIEDERIEELARLMEKAKAKGIPFELLFAPVPGTAPAVEKDKEDDDDDKDDK